MEAASTATKSYFIGPTSVHVGIQEAGDWFDVRGTVRFGDIEVPFIRLRGHILQRRREFKLPNGQIAIIPEEWFTDYLELFAFGEETSEGLNLRRHHLALVADLQSNEPGHRAHGPQAGQAARLCRSRRPPPAHRLLG
ncbi:hypothetical protein ACFQT0_04855 [Hymenobacter humi]|uniref:Uncharacterized protein n=1 Tax=Hymenobacter humi TaxID=1411620 RepID=A0ABW2U1L9_9BACT